MFKVGDVVWHKEFALDGQAPFSGEVIEVGPGEDDAIIYFVKWPDDVYEWYEEFELSLSDPFDPVQTAH